MFDSLQQLLNELERGEIATDSTRHRMLLKRLRRGCQACGSLEVAEVFGPMRLCRRCGNTVLTAVREEIIASYSEERLRFVARNSAGVVYFVADPGRAPERGAIKIGTAVDATNLSRRVSRAKGRLLATEPGGKLREAQLHNEFFDLRREGEWFEPHPALLDYIAALPAAA